MASLSNEMKRKWAIVENFCFAYICQPPAEFLNDKEWMRERDILFDLIANDVVRTDWKHIMKEHSHLRPITLSVTHAKEFYEAEVQKEILENHKLLCAFFERADWLRSVMEQEERPHITEAVYYMKVGNMKSWPTKAMEIKTIKQKKKK